jgi:hypothetical protein
MDQGGWTFLTARGRRRRLLRASSMGALAVGPRFVKLAHAAGGDLPCTARPATHPVVESSKETVRLGCSTRLPPIVTIESGDLVSFRIPGRIS